MGARCLFVARDKQVFVRTSRVRVCSMAGAHGTTCTTMLPAKKRVKPAHVSCDPFKNVCSFKTIVLSIFVSNHTKCINPDV